jgi:hypothetical protein
MDLKYNFCFKNKYQLLFVYTYIFPIKSNKEFKLIFQQYLKKEININEIENYKKLHKNNIIKEKNNILIINVRNKMKDSNTFNKLWFYTNPNNIYNEIIDSFNNKLKKLNSKLYDNIISNFKFRDIFILLYINESI